MKKWEERNNQIAHQRKLKSVKPSINSNIRHTKNNKSCRGTVNSKTPLYAQKYFSPENFIKASDNFPTEKHEIRGKTLFGSNNQEAQGGAYVEEKALVIEGTNSFMNSTVNHPPKYEPIDSKNTTHNSFPLSGSTNKVQSLPIFKLLQAFKLQQYAKTFADLGHGFEVYKIALLLPRQRHELLTKLNLMPGHRARFLSLFEIIDQIYPKEEKFRMLQNSKKVPKSRSEAIAKTPKYSNNQEGQTRPAKKKRTLMRQYNMLDKNTKKDINDDFIKRIKENKLSAFNATQNINIQNVLEKHVSKSKTRKAIKKIFPPSLYDKYQTDGSSNSQSRSRSKKRKYSSKGGQKIHNAAQRNKLPPLPEILPKRSHKYIGKSVQSQGFEIRRTSTGVSAQTSLAGRRAHQSQKKRREDLEIQAMSATKYSQYTTNQTRPSKSRSKGRNHSEDRRIKAKKPQSLTRQKSKGRNQRTAISRNRKKRSKNSKSKSGSKKRKKQCSREGILSTSAASNAGRLISSASSSDKRTSNKGNNSNIH